MVNAHIKNNQSLTFVLPDLFFFMECGICNAIKKWFTKKDDKDDMTDKSND